MKMLDTMWIKTDENKGYFCRAPYQPKVKFAFTNYGVSYGIQSVALWPERVEMLNNFFDEYHSGDAYDTKSITHVMHMNSLMPGVFLQNYKA